jgi:hypothetical protein
MEIVRIGGELIRIIQKNAFGVMDILKIRSDMLC